MIKESEQVQSSHEEDMSMLANNLFQKVSLQSGRCCIILLNRCLKIFHYNNGYLTVVFCQMLVQKKK